MLHDSASGSTGQSFENASDARSSPSSVAKPDGVITVAWTVLQAGGDKAAPAKRFDVGPDGALVVVGKGVQPSADVFIWRNKR